MADANTTSTTLNAGNLVQLQIYTGIIAGGTLGTPAEFLARQKDMIESMDDLRSAASNNLAAFILALPGRFSYEIGIVSSYTTAAGFTQRGAAVRIISGYTAKGAPKYKTTYNKFAIMKIIVKDEKGKSIKLQTIVLGPVNAVDFQPKTGELDNLQQSINTSLFTSNTSQIQNIITTAQVSTTTPTTTTATTPPAQTTPVSQVPAAAPATTTPAESLNNFSVISDWAGGLVSNLSFDASFGVIRNAGGGVAAQTRDPNPSTHLGVDYYNSTPLQKAIYAKYLQLGGAAAAASSTSGTTTTSGSSSATSSTSSQATTTTTSSSTASPYTFKKTQYGTIEIYKNGVLQSTSTVASAQVYGYTGN